MPQSILKAYLSCDISCNCGSHSAPTLYHCPLVRPLAPVTPVRYVSLAICPIGSLPTHEKFGSARNSAVRDTRAGCCRYYDASLCLLAWRLQRLESFPECSCTARDDDRPTRHRHARSTDPANVPEISIHTLSLVDLLNSRDNVLYAQALSRMYSDLRRSNLTCLVPLWEV